MRRDQVPTEVFGQQPSSSAALSITVFPGQFKVGQQSTVSLDIGSSDKSLATSFDVYIGGALVTTTSSLPVTVTYTPLTTGQMDIVVIGRSAALETVFQATSSVQVQP